MRLLRALSSSSKMAVGALAALLWAVAVPAATFTVTKTADTADGTCDADCSLREAIVAANANGGPDAVDVPAGTYVLTLSGAGEDGGVSGDLDISDDIAISGTGTGQTVIDGDAADRVLHIHSGTVDISDLTIRNGAAIGSGGGVLIDNATSTSIIRAAIADNTCSGLGGGIQANAGIVTIDASAITGNFALAGGGIGNFSIMTVINSTISDNTATNDAGGFGSGSLVTIINTTIADNIAGTVGGGLESPADIRNSIIAANTPDNCSSVGGVSNHSLDDDGSCGLAGTGDISNAPDAGLAPLQNNGGPTDTHALCTGVGIPDAGCTAASPALDAGSPAIPGSGGTACEASDQRGDPRPVDGDGDATAVCDMGAYEAFPICPPVPLTGCLGPSKSILIIKDSAADDARDKLVWKWIKGPEVLFETLGDPRDETEYSLCLYDQSGLLLDRKAPPGGTCDGEPCWKLVGSENRPKGFKYKDNELTPDGLQSSQLKSGEDLKSKMLVKGRGSLLQVPDLASIRPDVHVQLINSDRQCWASVISAADVIKSDEKIFKGKVESTPGVLPTPTPTPINILPTANADVYNGAVGNTLVEAGVAPSGFPAVSFANGVLDNDDDPDGQPVALTVTAISATALGGAVAMNPDGNFTYTPPPGVVGVESFTYDISDGQDTDSATVTINLSQMVWYVDNSLGANGNGTSPSPYNTLAGVRAPDSDGPGDTIFLHSGSGSYAGGIPLETNQRLIGQGVALVVNSTTLVSASTRPVVGNTSGAGIDLASGNTIRGLDVNAESGIVGSGFGNLNIDEVSVTATSGVGVDLANGAPAVTLDSVSAANSPTAGIVLSSTSGSFSITGNGAPAPAGGIISNAAVDGISLSSAAGVSIAGLRIDGAGVHGVDADASSDLTLTDCEILNAGNANEEHGMRLREVTGTVLLDGVTISDMHEDGIDLANTAGALDLTLRDVTIANNDSVLGEHGLLVRAGGTAQIDVVVEDSAFADLHGDGINVASTGLSTSPRADFDLVVQRTSFQGDPSSGLGVNAVVIQTNLEGGGTFTIENNNATDGGGFFDHIANVIAVKADSDGLLRGIIRNNEIDGSEMGFGIDLFADGLSGVGPVSGRIQATVDSNTISNTFLSGINGRTNDGNSTELEVKLVDNLINMPLTTVAFGGAIEFQTVDGAGERICLNLATGEGAGNNDATGAEDVFGFRCPGIEVLNVAGGVFELQGFGGGDDSAAEAFIDGNNVSVDPPIAFTGFVSGVCDTP
jgi:CSLREA domain-containing protein